LAATGTGLCLTSPPGIGVSVEPPLPFDDRDLMARFGEVRQLPQAARAERLLYRVMGVADPAHWLHFRYFSQALDSWQGFAPNRILDAGSGRGDYAFYLARRFPEAQVVGVDFDAARVARCRELTAALGLTNVTFQTGDLVTIGFDEPFDLIVSIDVLEHIVEQKAAIHNLKNNLAPDGRFFFHIPTVREKPVLFSGMLASFHEWAEHEHIAEDRRAEEFTAIVADTGLTVERSFRTFGRYTGELAVSLFALPHRNSGLNRILQGLLAPVCRVVASADGFNLESTRYAVGVMGHRPR
jgi:SAM-dependent methyltransferase